MKIQEFFGLFKKSFVFLMGNPLFYLFGFVLWAIMKFISDISAGINLGINNSILISVWLFIFGIISLAIMSFFFAGLIGMAKKTDNSEILVRDFFVSSKKFWFKTLVLMIFIVVISAIIGRIAHLATFYTGLSFGLELNYAVFLYILIYFAGLAGILVFLTFSIFCLVIYKLKIRESLKKSFSTATRNYPLT